MSFKKAFNFKTYYSVEQYGQWVRYFYDPSLKFWTSHVVTAPNYYGDQISSSMYETSQKDVCLDISAYKMWDKPFLV